MTSNARQGHALAIPISFHAQGAMIVMPSQISFGDAPVQTAVSRTFTVRNDGDVAAQVAIPMPDGEISVQLGAGGGPVTIEPGGSVTGEARNLPSNLGPDLALPGVAIAGPTCGEPQVLISLSGQGVPRGGVVVGAGSLDFGGSATAAMRRSISNAPSPEPAAPCSWRRRSSRSRPAAATRSPSRWSQARAPRPSCSATSGAAPTSRSTKSATPP
jgi:hypothetical protein